MDTVYCSECGKVCTPTEHTPGYGKDSEGNKFCYDCCAKHTEKMLMELKGKEKLCLYLTEELGNEMVGDWTGKLKIKPLLVRKGRHNIARSRYDVWFTHKGKRFHGVNYGEFTQILHVKALKN